MIEQAAIEEMITSLPDVALDYPFGEGVAVYKIGDATGGMFALIQRGSKPVRLSLKCDPQLAGILREKYETVLPGQNLNTKHWNTILCTGQVPEDELRDLIRHAYELVRNS